MSHRWLLVVYALATLAVGLTVLAFTRPDPASFAYRWYWQNDSVGNFAADATLAVLAERKIVKEWRAKKARDAKQDRQQAEHGELLRSLHTKTDRIHAHLGIEGN
jgi:hypothetical protein